MSKARFLSSALDGNTVTMSVANNGTTLGPLNTTDWGTSSISESLTVTVEEVLPTGDLFPPLGVEWRIRVSAGLSYSTPDYNVQPVAAPYDPITTEQENTMRLAYEAHDPSFQRCQFVLHTGDTGNYRNDWVGSAAHRDKSKQYGQNPGHVYSEPGTYTGRSIYVYDDEGNWGTLALDDLVVVDPDTVFDDASTIVVDPLADTAVTGDWADAPAHLVANRFNTLDAASERFNARKNNAATTKGMRICIKSGSSFTERARTFRAQDAKGQCLVDTYGGSAGFTYSEKNLDVATTKVGGVDGYLFEVDSRGWAWRLKGGSYDFGYDVADGRPTNASGWAADKALSRGLLNFTQPATIWSGGDGDPSAKVVLDNVDCTGVGWFVINVIVNNNMRARATALFVNDCEFWDNADYTIINPMSIFALGTKTYTSANTDLGGMGRSRAYGTSRGWRGHPIFLREQVAWTIYIRGCYMESRGGWSGIGVTGYRGGQRIMRLRNLSETNLNVETGGWVYGRGARKFICDSVLMDYTNLDTTSVASGTPDEPAGGAHSVVENCLLVFDPQGGARQMLSSISARTSMRNNVFLVLNSPSNDYSNTPSRDGTRFETDDNKDGRFGQFITAVDNSFKTGDRFENRHNTFVMLRADADIDTDGGTRSFAIRNPQYNETFTEEDYEMVEGHNVLYAPNLASPVGPSMSTIDLPAGMRVLDVWAKWIWEKVDVTLSSSVADGADTPAIPYPVDWYGNLTTGADYEGSAGCNTFTVNSNAAGETHYYEPPNDYPNSDGVQADSTNADQITVIHDCNSSGVVQGDGTGTHFKITNRSGETWAADDWVVILDRGDTAMTAETLTTMTQSEFKLYRPTTPQALDDGLGSLMYDFNRDLRPNAGYPDSPTGTNYAGAILPA